MQNRRLNHLSDYDYSKPGVYYVTLCVYDRFENRNVLGEISNGIMILNQYGKIVSDRLLWLFQRYNYIKMDEYVVMPDHFHGIIHIIENNNVVGHGNFDVGNGRDRSLHNTNNTQNYTNNSPCDDQFQNADPSQRDDESLQIIQHKIKPIPELIGAFKTTSSKLIHQSGFANFRWQKSFHDHIIHDEQSLKHIREYIKTNPTRWELKK